VKLKEDIFQLSLSLCLFIYCFVSLMTLLTPQLIVSLLNAHEINRSHMP
jgi:hypothetical protein